MPWTRASEDLCAGSILTHAYVRTPYLRGPKKWLVSCVIFNSIETFLLKRNTFNLSSYFFLENLFYKTYFQQILS